MRGGLTALGLILTFIGAAAASLPLHLGLAPGRRVVQTQANILLGGLFRGSIVVGPIQRLSPFRLEIESATVYDPQKNPIVRANGMRVSLRLWDVIKSIVSSAGPITIVIPIVHIDDAAVSLEGNPDGPLPIAETFTLLGPSVPPPPNAPPGRVVLFAMERFELDHAWAHGTIVPSRLLDTDLTLVAGGFKVGPDGLRLDLDRMGIADRAFLPAKLQGTITYHLRGGKAVDAADEPDHLPEGAFPLQMSTNFSGQVGHVEVELLATLASGLLTAKASVPRATPDDLAAFVPGLPIRQELSASVAIDGQLPDVSVSGALSVLGHEGPGDTVAFDGRLRLGSPFAGDVSLDARDVDLLGLANIPMSSLSATARTRFALTDTGPTLIAEATTEPTAVDGNPVPAVDANVVFDRGVLSGRATAHEPGAPVDAVFNRTSEGGLQFEASSSIASTRAISRIALPVDGSGRLVVKGTLLGRALDARANMDLGGIKAPGGVTAESMNIDGHLTGSVDALGAMTLDTTVTGKQIRAGGQQFESLQVRATGPALRPHLDAALDVTAANGAEVPDGIRATGQLDAAHAQVSGLALHIRRDGVDLDGTIARVGAGAGGPMVEGVELRGKGVGDFKGSLAVHGKELSGKLRGDAVDLKGLGKLADVPNSYHLAGLATLDVDLTPTRKGRSGHVALTLDHGAASVVSGLSAQANATFADDHVAVDGALRLDGPPSTPGEDDGCAGEIAGMHVDTAKGTLTGGLLDARAWADVSGSAHVVADDWKLGCLAKMTPVGLLLTEFTGTLASEFTVERLPGAHLPSLHAFTLSTTGLKITMPKPPLGDIPAWDSHGTDLRITADVDGPKDHVEATVSLLDPATIATLSVATTIDLATLLRSPERRSQLLRQTPFVAHVTMPRQAVSRLQHLPSFVRDALPPLDGEVGIDDGTIEGPIGAPKIKLHANAWSIESWDNKLNPTANAWAFPVDLEVSAAYAGTKASIDAHAKRGTTEVANAQADFDVRASDVLAGGSPPWKGNLAAALTGLPVGDVPFFADRDIGGVLRGKLVVEHLNDHPSLKAQLDPSHLELGPGVAMDEGTVTLDIPRATTGDASVATIAVALPIKKGGQLNVNGSAGVLWKSALPTPDDDLPADFKLEAKAFRLAALHPFVASAVSRLDGILDGDLAVAWKKLGAGEGQNVTTSGTLKITDGLFNLPQIGEDFKNASVTLKNTPDGKVTFNDFQAQGGKGKIIATGTATLHGLSFKSGDVKAIIQQGEDLPITVEGVPFGTARGEINLHAEKVGRTVKIDLKIPTLHVDLPAALSRSVQALPEDPSITMSHALGEPQEPRLPDALRYELTINLGEMSLVGNNIDVRLKGVPSAPPKIVLGDKLTMTGDVDLSSGTVEVLGKKFEVDRGLVRFRAEDASNPYLNVTAHWDASDGTRIQVDFVGNLSPVTNEKIKFTSNPAHAQQDIFAMLLSEGDQASTQTASSVPVAQTTTQAGSNTGVGVGGGFAAEQVNSLLSGIAPLKNLSTRLSTADDGSLRPSLVYKISDKISATVTFNAAPPGGPANATATQTQLNLDWHFISRWLLRASAGVGDQTTTGLDVLWQLRY